MSLDSGSVAEPHVCGPQIPTGASEYRLGPSGSIHTKGGRLTSMKHGPLAQLSPVAPRSKKGIVGDHGGVVAASSPSAFRAPFLVGLKGTTGQCKSRKRSQSVPVAAAHLPFCFTLSLTVSWPRSVEHRHFPGLGLDSPCLSPRHHSCRERWLYLLCLL